MIDAYDITARHFQRHIEQLSLSVDAIADIAGTAADSACETIIAERKLISCGIDTDAPGAMLFSELMQNGLGRERPALPVIELCARGAGGGSQAAQWLSKQLTALGQTDDLALLFVSQRTPRDLEILSAALIKRGVKAIWLGAQGTGPSIVFPDADLATSLALSHASAICLAELIDTTLFGPMEESQ